MCPFWENFLYWSFPDLLVLNLPIFLSSMTNHVHAHVPTSHHFLFMVCEKLWHTIMSSNKLLLSTVFHNISRWDSNALSFRFLLVSMANLWIKLSCFFSISGPQWPHSLKQSPGAAVRDIEPGSLANASYSGSGFVYFSSGKCLFHIPMDCS